MPDFERLTSVLAIALCYVQRKDNDFSWSSWKDEGQATAELEAALARVRSGTAPSNLQAIFAPTGPLQELSLSSGWGDESVILGDAFDEASSALTPPDCLCLKEPGKGLIAAQFIGSDDRFGDVGLCRCSACSRSWLRYDFAFEALPRSGRWFLGSLGCGVDMPVLPQDGLRVLGLISGYFYGGSHFRGSIGKSSGPIVL